MNDFVDNSSSPGQSSSEHQIPTVPVLITSADIVQDDPNPSLPATATKTEWDANTKMAWGFGVLFLIGSITVSNPLMTLIWIVMGLVLIPPASARIEKFTEWELTSDLKKAIVIGGLFATVCLAGMGSLAGGDTDAQYDKWINRVGDVGSPMP